jgi:hypothetical protein
MNKLFKSIWFPIILFALIELIFFAIGFFFMKWVYPCFCAPPVCSPCPSGNKGLQMLVIGIVPSLIIAIITYFLIRKFSK